MRDQRDRDELGLHTRIRLMVVSGGQLCRLMVQGRQADETVSPPAAATKLFSLHDVTRAGTVTIRALFSIDTHNITICLMQVKSCQIIRLMFTTLNLIAISGVMSPHMNCVS